MEVLAALLVMPLIKKIIDFIRFIRARDIDGVVTQSVAWVVSVLVTVLAAHTDWADGFSVFGKIFSEASWQSHVFLGLLIGSSASLVTDTIKALDNSQSAAIPRLVSGDYSKVDKTANQ